MALVASTATTTNLEPVKLLQNAIDTFKTILTDDQRAQLHSIQSVPDVDAVLVFTAELDRKRRGETKRGRSIATRLSKILCSVRDFSSIIDTFVSSHPEIAALVWGSIKLTMHIVINVASYYEPVAEFFMKIGHSSHLFREYEALFPGSKGLQTRLCDYHASLVRCCSHIVVVVQRSSATRLLNAFRWSFEQEFEHDAIEIERCRSEVEEEIKLATAQAVMRTQQLVQLKAQNSKKSDESLSRFRQETTTKLDNLREMQLLRDEQAARSRKQDPSKTRHKRKNMGTQPKVTPLMLATDRGHHECMRLLLSYGAAFNATRTYGAALQFAIGKYDIEAMEILLKSGAQVNAKSTGPIQKSYLLIAVEQVNSSDIAIQKAGLGVIRMLFKYGADANGHPLDPSTPLQTAISNLDNEVISLVLANGADVNTFRAKGMSPLQIATSKEDLQVVKLLLGAGARPESPFLNGNPPLETACLLGNCALVYLLVSFNTNPDGSSLRGSTPLQHASKKGYLDIVDVLLSVGATVDATKKSNTKIPLMLASKGGHVDIQMALLIRGANVNATCSANGSMTALQCAIRSGSLQAVEVLLGAGAAVEQSHTPTFWGPESDMILKSKSREVRRRTKAERPETAQQNLPGKGCRF